MELLNSIFLVIILILIFPATAFIYLLVLLIQNPEKIEKWSSLVYKFFINIGIAAGWIKRKYIQHDLQSRVNAFVKKTVKWLPQMNISQVQLKWVDVEKIDKRSFLDDNQIILVLSSSDPDDQNFVHGAYHFVSTSLLSKAKKYISQSQRESLDLFVTNKIINEEKLSVRDYFIDEYLHPGMQKFSGKALEYYEKYEKIEISGIFYSIYLNELDLIGGKVYGKTKNHSINIEVDNLLDFLIKFAGRKIGDDTDLQFIDTNSNLAIIIIGKSTKILETPEVYRKFINEKILPKSFKSIYLIGNIVNYEFMENIASNYQNSYEIIMKKKGLSKLKNKNGEDIEVENATIVLLKNEASILSDN
ncbi:hypothetical protein [Leptospira vanthielii]|uniref:Uncharacterized protein n=1 Tax=Leptospira vanthielii TaxID=293085 RepID=A0ABY2NUV6_9LEPT|nr:hypothetical protein [Leptospira vanthielii]TGM61805.1 hypothetical protein EHQ95_00110 [Leptospira vanthielii]